MTARRPHILIVGAGIIGASIAWHAARAGARVTVIDAGEPGGIATRQSLAWINASWGNAPDYFRLRVHAMEEWRRLERELPGIRVAWVGGLLWDLPPDRLRAFAAEHQSWGYGIRLIDGAEARRIEPHLAEPPEVAVHVADEGAVEPLDATSTLLAAATQLGAAVIGHTIARGVTLEGARVTGVVTDTGGTLAADIVVIAAGAQTPALAASAGLSLAVSAPANLLVTTAPHEALLRGLVMAPTLHIRQTAGGRLMAATGIDDRDPDIAARSLLKTMSGLFHTKPTLAMASHALARRPIPDGGLPIIGYADAVDSLYVAVSHSGVTLAPAVGRLAAREIIEGIRDPLLAPFGVAGMRASAKATLAARS
jgi:glycine/D-amino acid oxidase-like deaminating enzyme